MSPALQEQMMLRGDIDAAAVFTVTSYVNLIGQKVDPDKDIRWLYYSKFGVNPYANGLMVSSSLPWQNSPCPEPKRRRHECPGTSSPA
jgi:NitT/TauT family transport system substrate-binding protein